MRRGEHGPSISAFAAVCFASRLVNKKRSTRGEEGSLPMLPWCFNSLPVRGQPGGATGLSLVTASRSGKRNKVWTRMSPFQRLLSAENLRVQPCRMHMQSAGYLYPSTGALLSVWRIFADGCSMQPEMRVSPPCPSWERDAHPARLKSPGASSQQQQQTRRAGRPAARPFINSGLEMLHAVPCFLCEAIGRMRRLAKRPHQDRLQDQRFELGIPILFSARYRVYKVLYSTPLYALGYIR